MLLRLVACWLDGKLFRTALMPFIFHQGLGEWGIPILLHGAQPQYKWWWSWLQLTSEINGALQTSSTSAALTWRAENTAMIPMLKAGIKLVVLQSYFPSPFHDWITHLIKNIFLHALCYAFALNSEGMQEHAYLLYTFSFSSLLKYVGLDV